MQAVVGLMGLVWVVAYLPRSGISDRLRGVQDRLLSYDTFSPESSSETLKDRTTSDLSDCDTRSQMAILLLEMPMAEVALKRGLGSEFDQRVASLESRGKRALRCAPQQSFIWLLLFNLELLHGHLDQHSFDLLAKSYETSPNEAWISIRRIVIALPVVLAAPEPVREKILLEFKQLVRFGFLDDARQAYAAASPKIRVLLLAQLDPALKRTFSPSL